MASLEPESVGLETVVVNYWPYLIDQIRAAPYTMNVIQELKQQGVLRADDPHHRAVLETDVYRLRRGLCLISAASVCMNMVCRERIIGDEIGKIRVGDFYRLLLPHHAIYSTNRFPKGWLVVTDQGDIYHHAIVAFAKILGVNATPVQGFKSLTEFKDVLDQGGSVAVSLDNWFVTEQSLKRFENVIEKGTDGNVCIRVESDNGLVEKRQFEHGRHVVTLLDIHDNVVTIADSFNLPQTQSHGLVVSLPISESDRYLNYTIQGNTRAVVFHHSSNQNFCLPQTLTPTPVFIPREVMSCLSSQFPYPGSLRTYSSQEARTTPVLQEIASGR